ncbi:MAG: glycosyltransferase, partial [Bacteroides sp.]
DFDWCIEILKKTESTYYTKQVQIDYLEDGLTTQNRRASLIERFRIMQKHYGLFSTCWQHLWFVIRALLKK